MTRVALYTIMKKDDEHYKQIAQEYLKMIGRYAQIDAPNIFNKEIAKVQALDAKRSQEAYAQAFERHMSGYNVALHPAGKELDTMAFKTMIQEASAINFFIGGAYGFDEAFLGKCDRVVSISKLTFSHKLAKVILLEQIYRAFSIINAHPYHK